MKLLTSILILVLLALCHIVDTQDSKFYKAPNSKINENLPPKTGPRVFNNIEYKEDVINYFRTDTIFYSYENSKHTEIYNSIN